MLTEFSKTNNEILVMAHGKYCAACQCMHQSIMVDNTETMLCPLGEGKYHKCEKCNRIHGIEQGRLGLLFATCEIYNISYLIF